jgi:hypothetical protein
MVDIANIENSKRLAQLLLGNQQSTQGQMVGRFYVPASPLQNISNLANTYYGNKLSKDADDQRRQALIDTLTKANDQLQGTPDQQVTNNPMVPNMYSKTTVPGKAPDIQAAIGEYMKNPDTMQYAMNLQGKSIDRQTQLDSKKTELEIANQYRQAQQEATLANQRAIAEMNNNTKKEVAGIGADGQGYMERTAQAIASGHLPALSSFAMKSPMGAKIMARVMEINPQYSAADFATGQTALKAFTSGKQGNSVRSFNVAISHLDTLDKLSDALGNNDVKAVNSIANAFATQTGNPAPTNFNAAKKIVADEIVKAIVGSGGGVADREEAASTVSAANSPEQLKGVINTYKELMRGQLGGLRLQYEQSTGRNDFDRFLSESAKAEENQSKPVDDEYERLKKKHLSQ